jgi:hypothetical protein
VPIYDSVNGTGNGGNGNGNGNGNGGNGNGNGGNGNGNGGGGGNNAEFHIVGWGVVTVVDSNWGGAKNTSITIRKSHTYDSYLTPQRDLGQTSGNIEGAFTSPILLQ